MKLFLSDHSDVPENDPRQNQSFIYDYILPAEPEFPIVPVPKEKTKYKSESMEYEKVL
jgi:hypothetical protein